VTRGFPRGRFLARFWASIPATKLLFPSVFLPELSSVEQGILARLSSPGESRVAELVEYHLFELKAACNRRALVKIKPVTPDLHMQVALLNIERILHPSVGLS